MRKYFGKFCMMLLIILTSMILGYALRMHHEAKIHKSYQSQAEKELAILEEEFHSALKKPHKFLIFNGKFEVYPVKESEKSFYYKKVEGADQHPLLETSHSDQDLKVTERSPN